MLEKTAYLLVYHGSRDPRPQKEMAWLGAEVQDKLTARSMLTKKNSERTAVLTKPPQPLVHTAALELAPLSLEATIAQLVPQLEANGISHLQIIPLFLLAGVHVREDIPAAVENAKLMVGDTVTMTISPYLGRSPFLAQKLQASFSNDRKQFAKIIISHGSRRSGGNTAIEALGKQLGVNTAYWSVSPTLSEKVKALVHKGESNIEIIPYFLFPGGITDAIKLQVESLQMQFPTVGFYFGNPLSSRLSLADLIINEITL